MKKKKKASALMFVLIVLTAIMIIGTVTLTAVANTTRDNARFNDDDDMRLLAESGLNIGLQYLKNSKGDKLFPKNKNMSKKDLEERKSIDIPSSYCELILKDSYLNNDKWHIDIKIYNYNIKKIDDTKVYTIEAYVKNKKNNKDTKLYTNISKPERCVDNAKFVDFTLNQLINVVGNPDNKEKNKLDIGESPFVLANMPDAFSEKDISNSNIWERLDQWPELRGAVYIEGIKEDKVKAFLDKVENGRRVTYSQKITLPKPKFGNGHGAKVSMAIESIKSENVVIEQRWINVNINGICVPQLYTFIVVNGDLVVQGPIIFNNCIIYTTGNFYVDYGPVVSYFGTIISTGLVSGCSSICTSMSGIVCTDESCILYRHKFCSVYNAGSFHGVQRNLDDVKGEFLKFINKYCSNEPLFSTSGSDSGNSGKITEKTISKIYKDNSK